MTEQEKEWVLDKVYELIIADIIVSCNQHFCRKLSSEEVAEAVSIVYGKYLLEYKKMPKTIAETKLKKVLEFLELVCDTEEDTQEQDANYRNGYKYASEIKTDADRQKLHLCCAFADYCASDNIKSENWEGKHFAAFKLAKGLVKADIVANSLKRCTITF